MKRFSYLSPKAPIYLVYMMQQVEYSPNAFFAWLKRAKYLPFVMRRKTLTWTKKATILIVLVYFLSATYIAGLALMAILYSPAYLLGLLLLPFFMTSVVYLTVGTAWATIEKPRRKQAIQRSRKIFAKHPAIKIAIAGSYGKTTLKEILNTVLSEGKNVAMTPGNRNVSISHARWAETLSGDEDLLLIEYGESEPGDVEKFSQITKPDMGVITGAAPNHLDKYKNVENIIIDLLALTKYRDNKNIYINAESQLLKPYIKKQYCAYDRNGVNDWTVSKVSVQPRGMEFYIQSGHKKLNLQTGLLGRHIIGPLALAVALAHELGLSNKQIISGVAKTKPFEHRMQARQLQGAWIIDDTYNGNLEGMLAGLELLKELQAKRKIYVTPGLVDQGEETEKVHKEIGKAIVEAKLDKVVLMQNSITKFITGELKRFGYGGELEICEDPLEYYSGFEYTLAAGDIVMLQNDWTDNYS